ncbi:MAG: fumarylacetoacetate hydrolase family protein [Burkholderiales bacterium]
MRLGTYGRTAGAPWRAALFRGEDAVVDLADALAALGGDAKVRNPVDIASWIVPEGQAVARSIVAALDDGVLRVPTHPLSSVRHGPAFPRPGKFIAIGRNYMDHVREGQRLWAARGKVVELPTFPAAFTKYASAITAHGAPIVIPEGVANVDYEVELAFVIGTPAYRVPVERALEHVAAYTICNDVGARALQRKEMEAQIGLTLSKNFRTFAPLGPWLVTADEIGDPQSLGISLTVDGETRQHASTSDMIFSVAKCISYYSELGLAPGDMFTTGTPSGVALAMPEPERYYLKPGNVVRATIEKIGTLTNPVTHE